jgi:hypothetical protein
LALVTDVSDDGDPGVPEVLLSVTETAFALGVTRDEVLRRIENGTLLGRKVGSTWVVPECSLPS